MMQHIMRRITGKRKCPEEGSWPTGQIQSPIKDAPEPRSPTTPQTPQKRRKTEDLGVSAAPAAPKKSSTATETESAPSAVEKGHDSSDVASSAAAAAPLHRLRFSVGGEGRSEAASVHRLRFSVGGEGARRTSMRPSLVHGRHSYLHRDFANPEAETCWLSCLFQSLWHSRVFHASFEKNLTAPKFTPSPEEGIISALQSTWKEYTAVDEADEEEVVRSNRESKSSADATLSVSQPSVQKLVPASSLVQAFGAGYGDMSEAFASLQDELSQSSSSEGVKLGESMVLLPTSGGSDAYPTPEMAWTLAKEWQIHGSSLIAVDLSLPLPTADSCEYLAGLWVQAGRGSEIETDGSSFGTNHRLVALVCFMWNIQHYVAFCCRQRDSNRCLFFNDLPCLTEGAARDVSWAEVPNMCSKYSLMPRFVLYESKAISEAEAAAS
eukprot:TRINITY_DN25982_c0_g1_i1.p1 TRINITY_DN25982_c0_g1~~TRINITY_DN25982_c0_g1_i1.p1  ORF type:complete len:437 (+),score=71.94 TRINITY_DN25982_c0_g1_i1:57-1367(+)